MQKLNDIELGEKQKYTEFIKQFEINVNWAKRHYDKISQIKFNSICDVGCGDGGFCVDCVDQFGANEVYGLDIITVDANLVRLHNKVKYISGFSHNIPLSSKSVDYIASFDTLEHIREDVINDTIKEFARISKIGGIFTICHILSGQNINGINSHVCVHDIIWWKKLISQYFTGKIEIYEDSEYTSSFWHVKH